MLKLSVNFDDSAARKLLRDLPAAIEKAKISALNKAIAQGKTRMVRSITAEYKISAALVRERLLVKRATRGGSAAFTATLVGNPAGTAKRSMNLIHFVERRVTLAEARRRVRAGTQQQLRVQVKRTGGPKVIAGAFIGNNGRTVFQRVGKSRLPIEPVQTIGVPQMFSSRKCNKEVTDHLRQILPRLMDNELRYFVGRAGR